MDYKKRTYKGQRIYFGGAYSCNDTDQVYFADGAKSRVVMRGLGESIIDRVAERGYYENFDVMLTFDKSDMVQLTRQNVADFIGKRIYFFSEQYKGNHDAEGIAIIEAIDYSSRHPFTCTLIKSMDDFCELKYAFINNENEFCIGDSDRPVMVKVL